MVFIVQDAANFRSQGKHDLRPDISEQGINVFGFPEVEFARSRTRKIARPE
jgi:hypothetical protein